MSEEAKGKIAPEDSSHWKCNWISCEGGGGLAGNGFCPYNGEWDNPDCPNFKWATCQHGTPVYKDCKKCEAINRKALSILTHKDK